MLLVIGIDGATPELFERLTSTGEMPTVRSLMRHGVYGRLQSSVNVDPICAWSSVLTGVNPGKHGVWGLHNLVPESYQWRAANSRMLRAPTIAQLLTDRGQEVATVFVPMTFPAPEAEWTTIAGWPAPSPDAEGYAHPRRIRDLARRRLKDVSLPIDARRYAVAGSYEAGVQRAIAAMRARASIAEEVLGEGRWDFFAVNFDELDRVLRWYWHLFDTSHVDFREDLQARHGKLITELHQEVDAMLGRLVERLGPEDQLLLISPCGTQLNNRVSLCIPELMEHLGLLVTRSSAGGWWHSFSSRADGAIRGFLAAACELLPASLSAMLPEPEEAASRDRNDEDARIDYERSWVIPAPGGHLYLNLDREFPLGRVGSGQVDRVTMQIGAALQTAIDPATGLRPLEWAQARERVCSGPYVNRLPHIVTRWHAPRMVTGLTATGADGRVRIARVPGGHLPGGAPGPEGIIVAAGADIRRGVRIEGARVEDVAATIMHLSGQRVPSYFDGQVLEQAITSQSLARNPVRGFDRSLPRVIEDPARVEEASRAVEAHLGGRNEEV